MEYKRKRSDMIQVYKILHVMDRTDENNSFTKSQYICTSGHSKKLFKYRCNSELRKQTFSHRIIDEWNSLTESIVSANSVNSFKSKLDKH